MFREIDKDNRDCCNYLDAEYIEGVLRLTTCGACFYGSSIRGLPNYDTIETVLTEEEYNAIKDYIRISRGILSDVKHLVKHIKPIVEQAIQKLQSDEGKEFHLLGGFGDDRVFVVRPRRIEDIDCINTINKYITNGTSILNYYNIGEIYVLIFGADSFDSDLENYEYLTVKTASEVIKYNTQKIMDIITIMSKEEIETEDN